MTLQSKMQSSRKPGNSVFRPIPRDKKTWLTFGLFVLAYAGLVALLAYSRIGCVIRFLLRIPCPGCGLTRAYLALFRGDLAAAFRWHFMFPAVPLVFALILFDGKLFVKPLWNNVLLIALGAGFLARWILNLAGVLPA